MSDPFVAEQAWRDGDVLGAIEAADRALAAGTDTDGRAAGVAAAGAAADGALLDAAARWRGVGSALDGAAAARAAGRAALAAALAGDVAAAVGDLATARDQLPDPAPRGLTVLLGGAGAVVEAVGGALDKASRHLTGLAAASVAPDPMAAERLDELAVTVTAAGGDLEAARALLRALPGEPTGRARLLGAWLDLRTGHLGAAREALTAVAAHPGAAPGRPARGGRDRRAGPPLRRRRRHRGHVGAGRAGRRRSRRRTAAARRVGRAVGGRRAGVADRPGPGRRRHARRAAPRGLALVGGGHRPVVAARAGRRRRTTPPPPPTPRPGSPRSPHSTRGCAGGPTRPPPGPRCSPAGCARRRWTPRRPAWPTTACAARPRPCAGRPRSAPATPPPPGGCSGAGRGLRPGPGGPRPASGCCRSASGRWARWWSTG